jgi:hypothetical protein
MEKIEAVLAQSPGPQGDCYEMERGNWDHLTPLSTNVLRAPVNCSCELGHQWASQNHSVVFHLDVWFTFVSVATAFCVA